MAQFGYCSGINIGGIDSYTKLILHMNGVDGSTTFIDSSLSGHTVTRVGDAQIDTDQSKFGGSSGLLYAGSLSITDNLSDFNFGNGNFTIDFWMYGRPGTNSAVIAPDGTYYSSAGILLPYYTGANTLKCYISSDGVSWDIASGKNAGTKYDSGWHHYALIRSGTTFYIFQDGVLCDTWTSNSSIYYDQLVYKIGVTTAGTVGTHLDEFRISKGIARWTNYFTPPMLPYTK